MNNLTNNQRRESVGVIEEFKYLNDLTVLRTKTTHIVWFSSVVAEGTLLGIAIKMQFVELIIGSVILMIPFVLSMAYQLESITRVRTYVAVFIEPELDISFDRPWFLTKNKDTTPWLLQIDGVPYILLMPYFIYSVSTPFITMEIKNDMELAQLLPIWLMANLFLLLAARVFEKSYSKKKAKIYIEEWEYQKTKLEQTLFEKRFFG